MSGNPMDKLLSEPNSFVDLKLRNQSCAYLCQLAEQTLRLVMVHKTETKGSALLGVASCFDQAEKIVAIHSQLHPDESISFELAEGNAFETTWCAFHLRELLIAIGGFDQAEFDRGVASISQGD